MAPAHDNPEGRQGSTAPRQRPRYNRVVRSAVRNAVLGAGLLGAFGACSGPPPANRPDGSGGAAGRGSAVKPEAGAKPATGAVAIKDIGCLAPSCAFHAGAGAYFTCQSSGAGTCFHFGAPCTPANACMYDPAAKSYKVCQKPIEGTCQTWGAACAPASKCMYDATALAHRTCDAIDGGACQRYGALCAP